MRYKRIKAYEKDLKEFPGLSKGDIDQVDGLFQNYLFFEQEKECRKVWTSCCHKNGVLFPNLPRTVGPIERLVHGLKHNKEIECPYCGKRVIAKNRKMLGKGLNIKEYHAVLFLHTSKDGGTIWAQGYWATKDFLSDPAGPPLYKVTRVYRFRKGEAIQWEAGWGEDIYQCDRKRIQEPFSWGGIGAHSESYRVIGFDRLENSFVRYTWYEVPLYKEENDLWTYCRKRKDLMRYLEVAARYPENVEMLRKAGMNQPVSDMVYDGKKNADVLKWGETDPRAAFGLSKQELKAFLKTDRMLNTLRILKRAKKNKQDMTVEEADSMRRELGPGLALEVLKRAGGYGYCVPHRRLIRYLDSFAGPRCHGGGVTVHYVAQFWCDYIDAAVKLGYDLTNPINQMPKELERRHDEATNAVRVAVEEELKKKAGSRYKSLQKRYGFEDERFFIRAPYTSDEIIAEGKALKHCVGGYAERHAKGLVTILFMRNKAKPAEPYVTIEMRGNEIVQIHGYKNDRYSDSPRKTHKEMLDAWLGWLKDGSKRDKQGNPVMPGDKKKKKEANVA